MSQKVKRSELNYVISGLVILVIGGLFVKVGQEEPASMYLPAFIVGAVMVLGGLYLIGRGVISGRR